MEKLTDDEKLLCNKIAGILLTNNFDIEKLNLAMEYIKNYIDFFEKDSVSKLIEGLKSEVVE